MTEWPISYRIALAAGVVGTLTGVHESAILRATSRKQHIMHARKLTILLCRKYLGMSYEDIAQYINGTCPTLSRHYHSGVALARTDPEFRELWQIAADQVLRKVRERSLGSV